MNPQDLLAQIATTIGEIVLVCSVLWKAAMPHVRTVAKEEADRTIAELKADLAASMASAEATKAELQNLKVELAEQGVGSREASPRGRGPSVAHAGLR